MERGQRRGSSNSTEKKVVEKDREAVCVVVVDVDVVVVVVTYEHGKVAIHGGCLNDRGVQEGDWGGHDGSAVGYPRC